VERPTVSPESASNVNGRAALKRLPIRLVVFDLEGTLVDSSRDLATAINATIARIAPAASPVPVNEVRTFIGQGARSLLARSLRRAGVADNADDILPLFLDTYQGVLLETTALYPGVRESLERLAGRTLAVLTNKRGDMTRAILEGLGVAPYFTWMYGGGDVSASKPDPAGLLQLAAQAQALPAETLIVGDTAIDVQTGRAARTLTGGVTHGFDPDGLRSEKPDLIADDFPSLVDRIEGWSAA
jgi:phosphoglycolate phosphatase